MDIKPRFRPSSISKFRLWSGLICGLLISFLFFLFLIYSSEAGRLALTFDEDRIVLSREGKQMSYFFYGFLSLLLGSSVCFQIWFYVSRTKFRNNLKRGLIINDQSNLLWFFIYFFVKMLTSIGVYFLITNGFYVFNFWTEFNSVVFLALIVLFLNQWIGLRRTYMKSFVPMLIHLCIITFLAFLMSTFRIGSVEKINENLIEHNAELKYKLELPYLKGAQMIKTEKVGLEDLFVVVIVDSIPKIFYGEYTIGIKELCQVFESCCEKETRSLRLKIDGQIKMAFVKDMINEFRKCDSFQFVFSVSPCGTEIDPRFYKEYGLRRIFPPSCFQPPLSDSITCLWIADLATNDTLKIQKISLNRDKEILINEKKYSLNQLEEKLWETHPKTIFHLKFDDETTYQSYLEVVGLIYYTRFEKRDSISMSRYKIPFDELSEDSLKHEIKQMYPIRIVDIMSTKEKLKLDSLESLSAP